MRSGVKIRVEKRRAVWSSRRDSGGRTRGLEPAPKITPSERMLTCTFSHPVAVLWLPIGKKPWEPNYQFFLFSRLPPARISSISLRNTFLDVNLELISRDTYQISCFERYVLKYRFANDSSCFNDKSILSWRRYFEVYLNSLLIVGVISY